MENQKNSKDTKDPKEHKEPKPGYKRPKHRPEGREHEVHMEILERRMKGGPEATPDAYACALEQWKNLPGSVVRPPTDIAPPLAEEPSEPADQCSTTTPKPSQDVKADEEDQP